MSLTVFQQLSFWFLSRNGFFSGFCRTFLFALCLVFAGGAVTQSGATASPEITLAQLLESALGNNQQLISADATTQRYNSRIPLVDNLTEPLLSFYYLDFPISNISQGVTERINQAQAGPAQKTNVRSVRGKIITGRDMVENQALWYEYAAADLRLQIARQVREAFYRIYFLDKITRVTQQSIVALDSLSQASSAQYAVGKIRQLDVLAIQNQRYEFKASLLELQKQRQELATQLNYLAARSPASPLEPVIAEGLEYADLAPPKYSSVNLISGLFNNRPIIKGYQALGGRFRAMRGMVQMYFSRDVRTEAMFEADSGLRAIKAEATDFYNKVSADIQTAMDNLTSNRELAGLYGQVLIPQARQLAQASLADFAVGRSDYRAPIEALLKLHRYQEKYYQSLADFQIDLARLEGLSGVPLNESVAATAN